MQVKLTEADQYLQMHPIETQELIEFKLKELDAEINKLPNKKIASYRQAQTKCPELMDNEFHLLFLRCEVFNSDLAAKRLAKYWDSRIDIFGPEKAFQPLTLDKALKDDEVSIALGLSRLVGTKDPSGRNLLLYDPSKVPLDGDYDRKSIVRALWYGIHAVLEDEETQKKGAIFIASPKNAQLSQFDRKLESMLINSIQGCLPVRLSAIHVCYPPWFFSIVWKVVKYLMGARMRKRVRVHAGSEEAVLSSLKKLGLQASILPTQIGGEVEVNLEDWLRERREAGK